MRTDAFSCCYYLVKYPELVHSCRWLSRYSIAPDGSDSASALLFGRQEEYLERLQGDCMSQSGQSEKRRKRVRCFPIFCFLLVKIYPMRKIAPSHFWNAIPSDGHPSRIPDPPICPMVFHPNTSEWEVKNSMILPMD